MNNAIKILLEEIEKEATDGYQTSIPEQALDSLKDVKILAKQALQAMEPKENDSVEAVIENFFDGFKREALLKFAAGRREHGDDYKGLDFTGAIMEEVLDIINYHCMNYYTNGKRVN